MVSRKRARGFTLIEVMIALCVSVVGLLGGLALVLSLLSGGVFARRMTEASTLAQSKLEVVNAQLVTATTPADGAVFTESTLDAFGAVVAGGSYTRTTTWGTTGDGLRRSVVVTVSWLDATNRAHSVSATEERIP
jgi:prepilin-type N-terminal cleavage/methylation domain-containing protein